jgi:UDP-glucose 4-epimerase
MALCLVTGGAGFIGSHLVDALLARGHTVRVLDNLSRGRAANLEPVRRQVELFAADLADRDAVHAAMQGVELVFHQAGLLSARDSVDDPLPTHEACVTGTLHVLAAAREAQVRRVIYASSWSVYGSPSRLPNREADPTLPQSPYAVAKLAGEQYSAVFHYVYGLETVRLRYFSVFGPRQCSDSPYSGVIPHFLEAMQAGRSPVIYGDGLQSRDFIYVADVVQANLLAADVERAAGKVYNIGYGKQTTLLELVALLNQLLGTHLKPVHAAPHPEELRHSQADISRAQADLGFCPGTDLRQGLRHFLEASPRPVVPTGRSRRPLPVS